MNKPQFAITRLLHEPAIWVQERGMPDRLVHGGWLYFSNLERYKKQYKIVLFKTYDEANIWLRNFNRERAPFGEIEAEINLYFGPYTD